jgi:hypothetical protein
MHYANNNSQRARDERDERDECEREREREGGGPFVVVVGRPLRHLSLSLFFLSLRAQKET